MRIGVCRLAEFKQNFKRQVTWDDACSDVQRQRTVL